MASDLGCVVGRPNPLRVHVREAGESRGLASRLCGRQLPCVELVRSDGVRVPLRAHVSGLVVVYFVPGEMGGAAWVDGVPTWDAAQHRGFVNRRDAFEGLGARVFCVGSQSLEELQRVRRFLSAAHIMFSDPGLVLGRALGLPIAEGGGRSCYRRVVLAARDGVVVRVFGVLGDAQAAGSAGQVLAWIRVTGGR